MNPKSVPARPDRLPLSPQTEERVLGALNPMQREAVLSDAGSLLILAGAGSGKTRTLTCRIAHGVASGKVRPHQILAVTFSNRAAKELRERIHGMLYPNTHWGGGSDESFGLQESFLGITFHAMGLRVLRMATSVEHPMVPLRPGFSIYDDDDQLGVIRKVLKSIGLPDDASTARPYRDAIGWQKGAGVSPEQSGQSSAAHQLHQFVDVYKRYNDGLRTNNAADFGDLLHLPMQLLKNDAEFRSQLVYRFKWVLVDEFQDTNDVQMALVKLLCGPDTQLAVVGDDDQSIYRWRGARIANILDFPQVFDETHVIKLEQNYRSSGHILGAANAIIARNSQRHPKKLWTDAAEGSKVQLISSEDDRGEARKIIDRVRTQMSELPSGDQDWGSHAPIAIFYRTHAQSLLLEEALRLEDIPHKVYGGMRFFDRKEVKDVLAYARLIANPDDDEAFLRAVNEPPRGIGKKSVENLSLRAKEHGKSLLRAANEWLQGEVDRTGKKFTVFVKLMEELRHSIHGMNAGQAIEEILERSGYKDALVNNPAPDSTARLENLGALVNSAHDFSREAPDASMAAFLEGVVLRSQTDELEPGQAHVALMTLHNAKGLEFDHAYIVGIEDDLLPHANSREPDEIEEERRLLYVGMTRARKTLVMSYARRRQRYGRYNPAIPSFFLADLPGEHVDRMSTGFTPSYTDTTPAYDDFDQSSHYDYDSDPENAEDVVGLPVRHPKFGTGIIRRVIGRPGPDATVIVDFSAGYQKKILARFLTPVG